MLPEPIEVTLLVTKVLEKLNIQYLLGGSLATSLHGLARSTLDADIVADIHLDQVELFASYLRDAFYVDEEMIREAIRRIGSFNLLHLETLFKIDIFVMKQRPFDVNQMQRRISQNLDDTLPERMYVSSVEDIILAKLEWFKAGGETSDRQWQDILGVLRVQAETIDKGDLRKWAVSLGVLDLLERAFREAEI
jgi:hypothetical protein